MSISHAPHAFIPVAVTSNLWIIPWNSETLGSTIMIICSDKAMSTVPLEQTFITLRLYPACSPTSRYFHLHLYYEDHTMMMNVSMGTTILMHLTSQPRNLGYGNISTITGPHPSCRNWLMYLMFQSHSSTNIWSLLGNKFTYLHSTRMMMKSHPSYRHS